MENSIKNTLLMYPNISIKFLTRSFKIQRQLMPCRTGPSAHLQLIWFIC